MRYDDDYMERWTGAGPSKEGLPEPKVDPTMPGPVRGDFLRLRVVESPP